MFVVAQLSSKVNSLSLSRKVHDSAHSNIIYNKSSLPTHNFMSVRKFHTRPLLYSLRTLTRPDIITPNELGIKKGSSEWKAKKNEMLTWWHGIHPDHLAKTLLNFAKNLSSIRPGVLDLLIRKSDHPRHIKALYKLVTWQQVRWNKDLGDEYALPLAKAVHRSRAAINGIRLFASPWLRMFPSRKAVKPLFYFLEDSANERLYHIPYPNRFPAPEVTQEDNYTLLLPPSLRINVWEDVTSDRMPVAPKFDAHPETNDLEVIGKRWFSYLLGDHQTYLRTPDDYLLLAKFWSMLGDEKRLNRALSKRNRFEQHPTPDYLIPTLMLAKKEYRNLIDMVYKDYRLPDSNYEDLDHNNKNDNNSIDDSTIQESICSKNPIASTNLARVLICAHLAIGEDDQAFNILQKYNYNNPIFVYTHLGNEETIQKVKDIYEKLGDKIKPKTRELLENLRVIQMPYPYTSEE